MKVMAGIAVVVLLIGYAEPADQPPQKPLATALNHPEAVAVSPDGKVYIAVQGESGKEDSGTIVVVDKAGKASRLT